MISSPLLAHTFLIPVIKEGQVIAGPYMSQLSHLFGDKLLHSGSFSSVWVNIEPEHRWLLVTPIQIDFSGNFKINCSSYRCLWQILQKQECLTALWHTVCNSRAIISVLERFNITPSLLYSILGSCLLQISHKLCRVIQDWQFLQFSLSNVPSLPSLLIWLLWVIQIMSFLPMILWMGGRDMPSLWNTAKQQLHKRIPKLCRN